MKQRYFASRVQRVAGSLVAGLIVGGVAADGARAGVWTGGVNNSWNTIDTGNWTGGIPNAAGAIADFTAKDIASATTITIDSNVTVGTLQIKDSTAPLVGYTFSKGASGSLTFKASSGNAVLQQMSGSPVNSVGAFVLDGDLNITNSSTNTLNLNGAITGTGNLTVTSSSNGRIYFTGSNTFTGNFTLSGGSILTGTGTNAIFGNTGAGTGTRLITINNNALLQMNGTLNLGSNRRLVTGTTGGKIDTNSLNGLLDYNNQLSGSTPLTIYNRNIDTTSTITVNGSNTSFTGALNVATEGSGLVVVNLNAANAVEGNVVIGTNGRAVLGSAGTLASGATVALTGGILNTSAKTSYTVASGQKLLGVGTWTGATAENVVAGTLSLGGTHGTVGTASVITVAGGTVKLQGTTEFDLFTSAGSADSLATPGVAYGGVLKVANPTNFLLSLGQSWDLFSGARSGVTEFTNSFAYNDPNLPLLPNTLEWSFDYASGVLSVVAVPEPATAGMLALLGSAVLVRRRRVD